MSGQENTDVRNRAEAIAELPEKVKALDPGLGGEEAEAAVAALLINTDCKTVLGLSAKELISKMHNPVDAEASEEDEPKLPEPKAEISKNKKEDAPTEPKAETSKKKKEDASEESSSEEEYEA